MVIPCCYGSSFQGLVLCVYLELVKNVLKLCILIPLDPCKIYREQFGFVFRHGLVCLQQADGELTARDGFYNTVPSLESEGIP